MNRSEFRNKWKQLRRKAHRQWQWGTVMFDFDDLELLENGTEKQPGKYHKRYSKEAVEKEYKDWYSQS